MNARLMDLVQLALDQHLVERMDDLPHYNKIIGGFDVCQEGVVIAWLEKHLYKKPTQLTLKNNLIFRAEINMAGDIDVICQGCREFCFKEGLCVTVTACDFIYTGGEEAGVKIGLCNYPRFPTTGGELTEVAVRLGEFLMERAWQHTFLVVTDKETLWFSRRASPEGDKK